MRGVTDSIFPTFVGTTLTSAYGLTFALFCQAPFSHATTDNSLQQSLAEQKKFQQFRLT